MCHLAKQMSNKVKLSFISPAKGYFRETYKSQNINSISPTRSKLKKVRERVKIRNRYNQAPHLTQNTNGKVTTSHLDITNERQEVSPFPAGDHKASINRRARKHNKNKTEIAHMIHINMHESHSPALAYQ